MKNLNIAEIKDSVRILFLAKKELERTEQYYNEVKKKEQLKITNWMYTHLPACEKSFKIKLDEGTDFYTNPIVLNVTSVRTKKIIWDIEKLKKVIPKNIMAMFLTKTYTITDMDGLIKYLKKCGVNPKEFKKYIEVKENVSDAKIEQLVDTGKIKERLIQDCYEVKFGEPYIRLTEQKYNG